MQIELLMLNLPHGKPRIDLCSKGAGVDSDLTNESSPYILTAHAIRLHSTTVIQLRRLRLEKKRLRC